MKRTIVIASTVFLCGFGAGPFWGENAQISVAPPSLTIGAFNNDCTGTDGNEQSATCPYDAGTASGIIVSVCGTMASPNLAITPTTPMTYNGVQMTQLLYIEPFGASGGYTFGAIYYLNNPASGLNNIDITWEPAGGSNAWAIAAAQLTGQAATQTSETDHDNRDAASITSSISTYGPTDIVYHFGCHRGGDGSRLPFTSSNLTKQIHGTSGPTGTSDVQFGIATDVNPASGSNTFTTTNNARWVSGMLAIIPQ